MPRYTSKVKPIEFTNMAKLLRGRSCLEIGDSCPTKTTFFVIIYNLLLQSCSSIEEVDAWDRGYLADQTMQWEMNSRETRLEGHVYTSKEASSGGAGSAGGGCGCN